MMEAGRCSPSLVRIICFVALSCATEVGLSAQADETWCGAFQRVLASGRGGFDSVKGRPDPAVSLSWEGSVTFPGLTDCWIDQFQPSGNTIYTCASLLMSESLATASYSDAAAALVKCLPREWTIYREDSTEGRSPSLNAGPDPPELILAVSRDKEASGATRPVPGDHYALMIKVFSRPK
jgi:hypothetical protein